VPGNLGPRLTATTLDPQEYAIVGHGVMNRGRVVAVVVVVLALVAAAAAAALWAASPPRGGGGARTEAETAALFPVTVRRTGGIAGVDDTAVVTAAGEVALSRRQGPGGTCRLGATELAQLADLAEQTRPGRTPVVDETVADAFHYELESRGRTTSFPTDDTPTVVTDLIAALDGGTSRCH
jgi:hypothetical protein